MRNGELAAIEGRGVNRRTMKYKTKMTYRICGCFLAGMIWCLAVSGIAGCSSRETRFLEKTGYHAEDEDTPDQSLEPEEAAVSEEMSDPDIEKTIYIDVCGAVKNPGVYEMDAGARIFQAIDAAGGLLPEAAAEYVNRAGFLSDGQQIYIPAREEAEEDSSLKSPLEQMREAGVTDGNGSTTGRNDDNNSVSSISDNAAGVSGDTNEKVNLNTADEAALTSLTGIGESKAQAILAYREEHGGFSAIEDILNVPGIKEGTFTKIKDNISVE